MRAHGPENGAAAASRGLSEREQCLSCGRALEMDEIAVTRKLINRGASRFYCVDCLAAYFEVGPEVIRERIDYFRQTGCTLFAPGAGR